jgi:uncharacterized Ntn-hydrolase superfamily protein
MTFSIVGCDLGAADGAEWGVAVASKFLAAGSVVPWARADAGAIATQALANIAYGPEGLDALAGSLDAEATIERLTSVDPDRAHRQVGIVDASGRSAGYTGGSCLDWAGGRTGAGWACQGNILTGSEVVDAMVEAFEATEGDLAARLLGALAEGDRAGGDRRGRQSAALLVVRSGGGYLGDSDVAVDLRVDDHDRPVEELERLLAVHRLLFPRPSDLEFIEIDAPLATELRRLLTLREELDGPSEGGYDEAVRAALFAFVGTENLELRWSDDAVIERSVLDALRAG